jgi:hypothetical protein
LAPRNDAFIVQRAFAGTTSWWPHTLCIVTETFGPFLMVW